MSILNKPVSYFPNKNATTQGIEVNLLAILQSNKPKEMILKMRQSDEAVQKQLKENLPCYTVAGIFSRRCEEGIIQLSGLAAVDLDSAEDYDVLCLLAELKKIPSIAYAGLSCRGKRLFCIVPFQYPEKYVQHYERLIKSFSDMGLPMGDACHKSISQPRFISWNDDQTQFFNHVAVPYKLLPSSKIHYSLKRTYSPTKTSTTLENPFQWCNEQINKSYSFSKGLRHQYIMQLARYCNIKGISEQDTLHGCLSYVQSDFPETEISKIVKHIYTSQADSHNKIPFVQNPVSDKLIPKTNPAEAEPPKTDAAPALDKPNNRLSKPENPLVEPKATPAHEPNDWSTISDEEILELEHMIDEIRKRGLPKELQLDQCTHISNVEQFLSSHLEVVKNRGAFEPYLKRLIKFISLN